MYNCSQQITPLTVTLHVHGLAWIKLVINLLLNMLVYSISEEVDKSCALTLPPPESVGSDDDGPPTSKWVLVDTIGSSGLGTPERLTKLENLNSEHGETIVAYFSS